MMLDLSNAQACESEATESNRLLATLYIPQTQRSGLTESSSSPSSVFSFSFSFSLFSLTSAVSENAFYACLSFLLSSISSSIILCLLCSSVSSSPLSSSASAPPWALFLLRQRQKSTTATVINNKTMTIATTAPDPLPGSSVLPSGDYWLGA